MLSEQANIRLAVLLTCHNRVAKTLRFLISLKQQVGFVPEYDVYLVDDGSTDDTAEHVKSFFPDVVLLKGTGKLYWNGGMIKAWKTALLKQRYDFYLLVNDDVELFGDSLFRILEAAFNLNHRSIGALVGSVVSADKQRVTYGGREQRNWFNPLACGRLVQNHSGFTPCRFINGNFCLIPSAAVDAIGILDSTYTHNLADQDYGLRLLKAGFEVLVAPGIYGICDKNEKKRQLFDPNVSMDQRLSLLNGGVAYPKWTEQLYFEYRHGGLFTPVLILRTIFRALFPRVWLWLKQRS